MATGNVQPQLDMEEHMIASGQGGKKVFNIDSEGNIINFVGLAKSDQQDSQISLIDTLQELVQRLAPLAGAMASNAGLRVVGVTMPSTAVTGPKTSAQSIAEKNVGGVYYTNRVALENLTAVISNVNNCVGV
jgi:hypothetical protein